ncbi:MAG: bifunctional cytidylyltransferase/SDR family oxidoreductase [Bifidobacteriaceae bacterium]|jgi:2-C-methyl-D-erythritol 4-phosphate cytidylyltransferase|nr:bifunctional cytidylyltransferase/SDR family oxidoreductase [Bifidobacteriaceae bacterium]
MRTYGVVLAGGIGERLGLDIPKQMIKVAGKPILEHTVAALDAAPGIDEVIVMITPGWVEAAAAMLRGRYAKVTRILAGGKARTDTTRRVLDAIEDEEAKLVLHDAVRPLVDQRIIADCVSALDTFAAVDVVIPSSDTIVSVDEDETIASIPDRARLRRGQTPQAFWLTTLRSAYDAAARDPDFTATDDCGVVVKYCPGVRVACVRGSERNIKITHPVDLSIADKLFQLSVDKVTPCTDAQIEATMRGSVVVVIGGSYGIGGEIAKLVAQMGATVVCHSRSATGLHVQDPAAVASALAEVHDEHGRIDAVVVTAGVLRIGRLATMPDDDVAEAVDVNYVGPINVARAAYPYLTASRGHLLLFTSSSYTRGRQDYALYSSAKAAVVNLTQALSEEWSEAGIKVNVVNPERTLTPMRVQAFGEEDPASLLSAEKVARASVEVLASSMTGCVVEVRRDQPARAGGGAKPT